MATWGWIVLAVLVAAAVVGVAVRTRRRKPEDPLAAARKAARQLSRGRPRKTIRGDGSGNIDYPTGASCGSGGLD